MLRRTLGQVRAELLGIAGRVTGFILALRPGGFCAKHSDREEHDGTHSFSPAPVKMREWFARHHADAKRSCSSVFRKVGSGQPSITWPESVDEALCVGWIDGVRRRVDETCYTIRFTPRRPGSSIWSAVNIGRVAALQTEGRMQPAGSGRRSPARKENRSGIYAYENQPAELPGRVPRNLCGANAAAQAFFEAQPPGYRRTAVWQIVSAKQEATQRQKRLAKNSSPRARTGKRLF